MPRPLFILCSENSSLDRDSNLLSIFNLIEQLTIGDVEQYKDVNPAFQVRVIATWILDPEDRGEQFEFELTGTRPDGQPLPPHGQGTARTMTFGAGQFQRVIVHLLIQSLGTTSGEVRINVRLRKVGTEEWVAQQNTVFFVRFSSQEQEQATS